MAAGASDATISPIDDGTALNAVRYRAAFIFGATAARLAVARAQFMEHQTRLTSGLLWAFIARAMFGAIRRVSRIAFN